VTTSLSARLVGGPQDLPENQRVQPIPDQAEKIKIEHLGGYEHFERSVDHDPAGEQHVVFRWTTRTRIAE
jgi:hypothetical protein